jgi:hypothetical protein
MRKIVLKDFGWLTIDTCREHSPLVARSYVHVPNSY